MPNYIYIAASIDNFIATKDGGLDWLMETPNPDNSDYGFAKFMSNIDALVMGRNTYEKVLTFGEWPYSKPVFVLSNSLSTIPDEIKDKAEIVKGNVSEIVDELAKRGYHNLYIDGGNVIQSFLLKDLIDEMIITRIPVLLGAGIPLFGQNDRQLKFSLVKTEELCQGLTKSHYVRERE